MKRKKSNRNQPPPEDQPIIYGDPVYNAEDDIYSRQTKLPMGAIGDESSGSKDAGEGKQEAEEELDIPGAELDDDDEAIGSEDEENNYYSLGGDNHEDLEEDKS
ncbi:MAG TPA: hypothetical protein VL307_20720 [Chitinophagaceae bacterium]|nr:hypothetical protein [Chitinophagaceae bacterium]